MIFKIMAGYRNWEVIVFIIIGKLIIGNNRHFRRSEIITTDNIKLAEMISAAAGHKIKPRHPEETIQNTLNNLRVKGLIKFLGSGEYQLTDDGFYSMKIIAEKYPYDQLMKTVKELFASR